MRRLKNIVALATTIGALSVAATDSSASATSAEFSFRTGPAVCARKTDETPALELDLRTFTAFGSQAIGLNTMPPGFIVIIR